MEQGCGGGAWVGASDAREKKAKKKQALFGTIPDFHRVQMLGVGDLW